VPTKKGALREYYAEAAPLIVSRVRRFMASLIHQQFTHHLPAVAAQVADAYGVPLSVVIPLLGPDAHKKRRPIPHDLECLVADACRDLYAELSVLARDLADLEAPALARHQCARSLGSVCLPPEAREDVLSLMGGVIAGRPPTSFAQIRGLHYYAAHPAVRHAVDTSLAGASRADAHNRLQSHLRMAGWT
jgi:hypothetical protein